MKTQMVRMALTKDIMTKAEKDVYAHEIPLYEAAHPNGKVSVIGTGQLVELDSVEEFERLMAKFGTDEETGRPIVEEVYGRGGQMLHDGKFEINPNHVVGTPVPVKAVIEEKTLSIDELREQAEILGVQVKKSMNAATIKKHVDAKLAKYTDLLNENGIATSGLDL